MTGLVPNYKAAPKNRRMAGDVNGMSFDLAQKIRDEYWRGSSIAVLADKYDRTRQSIRNIVRNKTWRVE